MTVCPGNRGLFLAMTGAPNNQYCWGQVHFVSPWQGLDVFGAIEPGRRSPTHLPWAIIFRPCRAFGDSGCIRLRRECLKMV